MLIHDLYQVNGLVVYFNMDNRWKDGQLSSGLTDRIIDGSPPWGRATPSQHSGSSNLCSPWGYALNALHSRHVEPLLSVSVGLLTFALKTGLQ